MQKRVYVSTAVGWVTHLQVALYASQIEEGDKILIWDGRQATVLKKYRYIALTNRGSFRWSDLYIYNVRRKGHSDYGYEFDYDI